MYGVVATPAETNQLSASEEQDLFRFLLRHPAALCKALADFDDHVLPPSVIHSRHKLIAQAQHGIQPFCQSHELFPTPPPDLVPNTTSHQSLINNSLPVSLHSQIQVIQTSSMNANVQQHIESGGDRDQVARGCGEGEGFGGRNGDENGPFHDADGNGGQRNDGDDDDDDDERDDGDEGGQNDDGVDDDDDTVMGDMELFEDQDPGFIGEVNYINVYGGGGGPIPVLPGGGQVVVGPDRDCHRDGVSSRRLRREATRPYESRLTPLPEEQEDPPPQQEDVSQAGSLPGDEQQTTRSRVSSSRRKVDTNTEYLISSLCAIARDSLVDERGEAFSLDVHELIKLVLLGPDDPVCTTATSPVETSISPLLASAMLCEEGIVIESGFVLSQYMRILEFVAQVQRYKKANLVRSLSKVYKAVKKAALRAGQNPPKIAHMKHNYNIGVKVAHLIAAGTPYIMFFLSSAQFKTIIKKAPNNHISALHKLIRCPDDSPQGVLIRKWLIPAIAQLRQKYPMRTNVLFSQNCSIIGGSNPMPEHLWDVDGFDKFIENIKFETFVKPRDLLAWAPAMVSVSGSNEWNINHLLAVHDAAGLLAMSMGSIVRTLHQTTVFDPAFPPPVLPALDLPKLRIWDNIVDGPNLITIPTQFDPALNKRVPFTKTNQGRRTFTQRHRKYAAKAKIPSSNDELEKILNAQLSSGKKGKTLQYCLVDAEKYDGKVLRITDKNGDMIALLIGNMPEELRNNMMSAIEVAFPDMVKSIDSSTLSNHRFIAYHFSYYNRYSKKGSGTPRDKDPSSGPKSGTHTTPHASRELLDNLDKADMIVAAFRPVFDWIYSQLSELLPDEFTILEETADILPLGEMLPMFPFTGFVVNLNVRTIVHRDGCDKDICLVFQFSQSTGRELVLVEPGLVFRLRSGDGVVFRSRDVSHFNLDYVGKRVSFVFHTDVFMDLWRRDRNDWSRNVFMKSDKHE